MNNSNIATRRKTSDQYGIRGYWVNQFTKEQRFIENVDDEVTPGISKSLREISASYARAIWIYVGTEKLSEAEIEKIIDQYGGEWGTFSQDQMK